jgi:hypothetical protein
MTTTELIDLLERVERGASGRSREISVYIGEEFISCPEIKIDSAGDGCAGAQLTLSINV